MADTILDFIESIAIKEKSAEYSLLLKKYNEEIEKIEKKKGRECCCGKGCASCCKQIIIISDIEKDILADAINSMSFIKRCKLWGSLIDTITVLISKGLIPTIIRPDISSFHQRMLQERYFNANVPCIFLNQDNACSIYKKRPISCMTYKNYGNRDDCGCSPFVSGSINYDGIEIDIRKEMYDRHIDTNLNEYGFNGLGFCVLPYAVYDIMKSKRRFYDIYIKLHKSFKHKR